jgi:GrpB-like predicted nucleotidyltransferase (UPF0157 family)
LSLLANCANTNRPIELRLPALQELRADHNWLPYHGEWPQSFDRAVGALAVALGYAGVDVVGGLSFF